MSGVISLGIGSDSVTYFVLTGLDVDQLPFTGTPILLHALVGDLNLRANADTERGAVMVLAFEYFLVDENGNTLVDENGNILTAYTESFVNPQILRASHDDWTLNAEKT